MQEFKTSQSDAFKARQYGITTVDPNAGIYDYKFEIKCNLNEVFKPLKVCVDNSSVSVSGARSAWLSLHSLLHKGRSSITNSVSFAAKTFFGSRCSLEDNTWNTFWFGMLSQAFVENDKSGNSVRVKVVEETLEKALDDGNPLIGELCNALGSDISSANTTLDAHTCYFGALACYISDTRGRDSFSDDDMFKRGDAIGLRIRVASAALSTGLLMIEHDDTKNESIA